MIFIVASILASTSITIIFKLFTVFKVDIFTAIVFNYCSAILMGWMVSGEFPINASVVQSPTFPYAMVMGVLFITAFLAQGRSIELFGITITAILQRMSLLMTVIFALFYFDESISLSKILGLICAFLSIILVNYKPSAGDQSKIKRSPLYWFLPFFVFFSSGVIEIILQYVELEVAGASADPQFIGVIFCVAFLLGIISLMIGLVSGNVSWSTKSALAGIGLGIPNFLSIYFIMKALGAGFEGSYFFPVNNVAIIALATLIAFVFFKEKLSNVNIFGVVLALLAITLISIIKF